MLEHLPVPGSALATPDPGVGWNGWRLSVGAELGIEAVPAAVLLGVAVVAFVREQSVTSRPSPGGGG